MKTNTCKAIVCLILLALWGWSMDAPAWGAGSPACSCAPSAKSPSAGGFAPSAGFRTPVGGGYNDSGYFVPPQAMSPQRRVNEKQAKLESDLASANLNKDFWNAATAIAGVANWVGWGCQVALDFVPGVKGTVTIPLDMARTGAEVYGSYIDKGSSQWDAIKAGVMGAGAQGVFSGLSAGTLGAGADEATDKITKYTATAMGSGMNQTTGWAIGEVGKSTAQNALPAPKGAGGGVAGGTLVLP